MRHEARRLADGPSTRLLANIALLGGLAGGLAGCNEAAPPEAVNLDGNSRNGAVLIAQFGCGGCHVIPGISGADGAVGPPLTAVGRRTFIAGLLNNSPDNMTAWLQDPQAIVPGNAMPQMDISAQQARDISAYLYTLR
jgi:cytochrome c2